jgi:hypothetical protein
MRVCGGGGVGGEGSKVNHLLYVISYVCVVGGGGVAKRRNVGMEGGQWEGLMGGCPGVFIDPGVEALFVRSLCENRGTGGGGGGTPVGDSR